MKKGINILDSFTLSQKPTNNKKGGNNLEGGTKDAPVKKKRKSQKYLKEVMTYIKNESKWEQAEKYCKQRGWEFKIFTENTLKSLGIRLLTS